MLTYKTGKGIKFVEEDNYQEGCLPETAQEWEIDITFQASTKDGIINQISDFFGVEKEDLEINSCDEAGRIDIGVLENAEGYQATEREKELWKQGKLKLWSAIYTYYVTETTRKAVDL